MNPRPESLGRLLRFGPFELDTKAGELFKYGIRVRLQEQPFQLLLCLLESPGAVVSREELRRRIWADGTFVDYEHGLNAAVTRLRQILRDSAENPRYIETVARRGYRFVAPVTEAPALKPDEHPEALRPGTAVKLARFSWLRPLTGALAAVFFGLFIFWLMQKPRYPTVYSALPLTSYVGSEVAPSFAPDGDRVAFAWDGEKQDNFDIYVKQIGSGALLRLTTDPRPDLSPAWSPDGRSIAFLRFISEEKAEVLLVPSVAAGSERSVREVRLLLQEGHRGLRLLSWSSDGKWLVIPESAGMKDQIKLTLLSPGTGEQRELASSVTEDVLSSALSPDRKRLVYTSYSGTVTSDLYVLELDQDFRLRGKPTRLTSHHRHVGIRSGHPTAEPFCSHEIPLPACLDCGE